MARKALVGELDDTSAFYAVSREQLKREQDGNTEPPEMTWGELNDLSKLLARAAKALERKRRA
jgi:hypothetical protein